MKVPPFARLLPFRMASHGVYPKGWPAGAVVHYTAGRDGAEKTIQGGVKDGYTYWCIQKDGSIMVAHSAEQWGYHAGKSAWKGFPGGVNSHFIGIEINNAGVVKPSRPGFFKTYYGVEIPESSVRHVPAKNDNEAPGYYEKYTTAQEATLIKTLLWLKAQNPSVFSFDNVAGHDEVSGPKGIGYWRKTDPGGALSMTMSEFRALLKAEYAKGVKPSTISPIYLS